MSKQRVTFIEGGLAVDDRGQVTFCNSFDMSAVKRLYQVSNHSSGFVRAWHGHKKESKYVFVSKGSILLATVEIKDWEQPDRDATVEKFVLSAGKPGVLLVPGGFAHGYKTLTDDATILFFSTVGAGESLEDDYRFHAYYWNPWQIVER